MDDDRDLLELPHEVRMPAIVNDGAAFDFGAPAVFDLTGTRLLTESAIGSLLRAARTNTTYVRLTPGSQPAATLQRLWSAKLLPLFGCLHLVQP